MPGLGSVRRGLRGSDVERRVRRRGIRRGLASTAASGTAWPVADENGLSLLGLGSRGFGSRWLGSRGRGRGACGDYPPTEAVAPILASAGSR